MFFTFGLRSKVILVASFLLILPWLGYQFIWQMEQFLRQGQQQTLLGTTRAIATALHERPTLFNRQASLLETVQQTRDLYAYPLQQAIRLDGILDDWQNSQDKRQLYAQAQTLYQADSASQNPISFYQQVGKVDDYLYAYLQVTDKNPVYQQANARNLENADHLIIALSDAQGVLQHYVISAQKSGWVNAYSKPVQDNNINLLQREKRIQGYWLQTAQGYNIEFRLPLSMLGDKLGLSLHSVSSIDSDRVDQIVATSATQTLQQLGTILVPSTEIDNILKGIGHSPSRLWIVDRHQRVLATVGDIQQANGVWAAQITEPEPLAWWQGLLSPLYNFIFPAPATKFIDQLQGATQLNSEFITHALAGESQSNWWLTADKKATILSAATPIFVDGQVMGVVIAEENTNGIRKLRHRAFETLFDVLFALILVAIIVLLSFATHITSRIRRLRDQTDAAIDTQGRISAAFIASTSSDEIGDLSRGLSEMVKRLGQYHFYLENLAARLSHELRTPVAVVRSSLENLALLPQTTQSKIYIERSQQGITRLNRILTNMSEATRIEQSLQHSEKIALVVEALLTSCVQGYQMTYPQYRFQLAVKHGCRISADPDLIVQCLDKLVNNAMEFSLPSDPICFNLHTSNEMAVIEIHNIGPLLPLNMSDELLNSMVSVRSDNNSEQTHLGLGLFIAKMIVAFHQGQISIANNQQQNGVIVRLQLPINREQS